MKAQAVVLWLAAIGLASCSEPFGPRDNPVDTGADGYQGFRSVASVAEVGPDTPVAHGSTVWLSFLCSRCLSADLYGIRIEDSSGSVAYERSDFTSYVLALTDASVVEGPYAWSVRGHEAGGDWSEWSAGQSVDLAAGVTGEVSPADRGVTLDITPVLDWGDVDGAASYELQIGETSESVASATPAATTASQYQVPTAFAYDTTQYWRVRPLNGDGVPEAWSATWFFEVTDPLLDMVMVVGGTFSMGSTIGDSDEEPLHTVTVSSFLVSKYEVTQEDYRTVMGYNPSSFTGDTSRPVEKVNWYHAVAFCNALSALGGLDQAYTIDGPMVSADWSKDGYRLPTEAEWEYAARGGNESEGYTYSGSNTASDVAWYTDNSGSTTHPVGSKAANELGIHDMSGNVWEWCWDWFGGYSSSAQTDPTGPESGTYRVLRGGSWYGYGYDGRCANRNSNEPAAASGSYGYDLYGIRVVRRAD